MGVVYLLYASRRAESTRSATSRIRLLFAAVTMVLALVPVAVGLNGAQSVKSLVDQCDQLANDPKWVGICP